MTTNAIPPPPSEGAIRVATAIRFRARQPTSGTWRAIVETSLETVRPDSRKEPT